jgi:hypothetical protein
MARSGVRRLCPVAVRLRSALFGPIATAEAGTGWAATGNGAAASNARARTFLIIVSLPKMRLLNAAAS